MRMLRSARLFLLALLVAAVPLAISPAPAHAAVFISVGFAPPVLPVYVQPLCPEPGLMWTPGYWAYGPDGYYWVPGAWVPAPYVGALWTPGYWGWSGGLYVWHVGYWGPHVGYYGGVNYGFGYMGIGFAGGVWRGGVFAYNTAVVRVNTTVIRNVYVDRTVVQHDTIVNDRHVAFSGGPGGINHPPTVEERSYMNERHTAPTSFQTQHAQTAMHDHNAYAKVNGGHPSQLASARPLQAEHQAAPASRPMNQARPTNQSRPMNQARPTNQARPQQQTRQQARPAAQSRPQRQAQPEERSKPEEHQR
jgi:hypothetical protein